MCVLIFIIFIFFLVSFSILGPIRVLRKLIAAPNRAFFNYIIDNNFFAPIVQVLLENGDKYNALNSAILELFHFMSLPQVSNRFIEFLFVFFSFSFSLSE